MTPVLPKAFCAIPLAHRALHDRAAGRPENSRAAIRAAVEAGYGIEIDLQLSKDGEAMVFHDDGLDRLTAESGLVRDRTAAELQTIRLTDAADGIPTFLEVLDLVAGRVPLLVEVKDQDGAMGPNTGNMEHATAQALEGYTGPVALMSFNPHTVAKLAELCPKIPRGITSCAETDDDFSSLDPARRKDLAQISVAESVDLQFISHDHHDLASARVRALKERGLKILCWTVRSPEEEAKARAVADNVTFEGYRA